MKYFLLTFIFTCVLSFVLVSQTFNENLLSDQLILDLDFSNPKEVNNRLHTMKLLNSTTLNMDSSILFSYTENGQKFPSEIYYYEYDTDRNLISFCRQSYIDLNPNNIYEYKYTFEYDENGRLIEQNQFVWDQELLDWDLRNIVHVEWNEQNSEIDNWKRYLYINADSLFLSDKYQYVYNVDGELIEEISFNLNIQNELKYENKIVYLETEFDSIKEREYYYWVPPYSYWRLEAKSLTTYHDNKIKKVESFTYNANNASWKNQSKRIYIYNQSDELETLTFYTWENEDNYFRDYSRRNYLFDFNGNESQLIFEYKLEGENFWRTSRKTNWYFDLSYDFGFEIYAPLVGGGYVERSIYNPVLKFISSNYVDSINQFKVNYDVEYFYSDKIVSINDIVHQANIYPNPFSEELNINISESYSTVVFKLFSIDGKLVNEKSIKGNAKINMGNLNSGIFFYKVYFENELLTSGKVIKQ